MVVKFGKHIEHIFMKLCRPNRIWNCLPHNKISSHTHTKHNDVLVRNPNSINEGVSSGIKRRVIFSGIQPSGVPHLGNYLGALKSWVSLQETDDVLFCIVDLHSITAPQDPVQLNRNILEMSACLLACGIDPEKSILFKQSQVSEHAELAWVLGSLLTINRLKLLPQWKAKKEGKSSDGVLLGLFTYPVLMVADILLYKATHVPVGEDQLQHIQLCQHIGKLFNRRFTQTFPIPTPILGDMKRVKSLRNPGVKMSKSDSDPLSRIDLTDSPDEIRKKFKKAMTDFTSAVTYDPEGRPGVSNMIDIHSGVTGLTPDEICDRCSGLETAEYKMVVADSVIEFLNPIRNETLKLLDDKIYLKKIIKQGSDRASDIASVNLNDIKNKIGLS